MESNNQKSQEYLDEVFEMWTVESVDKENDIEYRHPTSEEHIVKGQELIKKAKECNPDDEEVKNRLDELGGILDEATEKKFGGNRIFLIGVIIAVILWGGGYIINGFKDIGRDYTAEQGKQILDNTISSYQKSIDYVQTKEITDKEKTKQTKELQDKLDDLKKYDGEKYAKKLNRNAFRRGVRKIFKGLFYFLLLGLYYWSARMPVYMINKRAREIAIMSKGTGWASKILMAIVGIFFSMPITEYYDKWSDGSVTYSEDNLPLGMMQLALKFGLPLLIIAIVAYIIIAVLPILIIINVLRNKYPQLIGNLWAKITKKA